MRTMSEGCRRGQVHRLAGTGPLSVGTDSMQTPSDIGLVTMTCQKNGKGSGTF